MGSPVQLVGSAFTIARALNEIVWREVRFFVLSRQSVVSPSGLLETSSGLLGSFQTVTRCSVNPEVWGKNSMNSFCYALTRCSSPLTPLCQILDFIRRRTWVQMQAGKHEQRQYVSPLIACIALNMTYISIFPSLNLTFISTSLCACNMLIR